VAALLNELILLPHVDKSSDSFLKREFLCYLFYIEFSQHNNKQVEINVGTALCYFGSQVLVSIYGLGLTSCVSLNEVVPLCFFLAI
jgi:hypothetical protein